MKHRALIVIGGEAPPLERLSDLQVAEALIIAADSGLDQVLAYGWQPDWLVGDLDSVSSTALASIEPAKIRRFPVDKDFTDTELAIQAARQLGAREIILIGGGGGRLDHLLGLWALFTKVEAPNQWYTGTDVVWLIDQSTEIELAVHTVVSFFAVGPTVKARTTGLQWPLDELDWSTGDAGLSNRVTGKLAIELISGRLLMVWSANGPARKVS